jgi:hypothetical protein
MVDDVCSIVHRSSCYVGFLCNHRGDVGRIVVDQPLREDVSEVGEGCLDLLLVV